MLATNDKIENLSEVESLSKEVENKELNENFRTGKTIPQINSTDGLDSRIKGTGKNR